MQTRCKGNAANAQWDRNPLTSPSEVLVSTGFWPVSRTFNRQSRNCLIHKATLQNASPRNQQKRPQLLAFAIAIQSELCKCDPGEELACSRPHLMSIEAKGSDIFAAGRQFSVGKMQSGFFVQGRPS